MDCREHTTPSFGACRPLTGVDTHSTPRIVPGEQRSAHGLGGRGGTRSVKARRDHKAVVVLYILLLWCGAVQAQQLAFPSAEGFGRFSVGGRAGVVYHVTNLNDTGVGSFRDAVTRAGRRTVVFDISGYIACNNVIQVYNPFLTIAGQTAPAPGVTVRCPLLIKTSGVIIRHLRIRPGGCNYHSGIGCNPESWLAFTTLGDQVGDAAITPPCCNNNIFDHVSLSWSPDDVSGVYARADLITYQHSIMSEPIHNGGKSVLQGKAFLLGGTSSTQQVTVHHNFLAHSSDRTPFVHGGTVDWVNNFIYDYNTQGNFAPFSGSVIANIVGNYYLRGPNTTFATGKPLHLWGYNGGGNGVVQSFALASNTYFSGNIEPVTRPNDTLPETAVIDVDPTANTALGRISSMPLVTTTTAPFARDYVRAHAGARIPQQDTVDSRILSESVSITGIYLANDPSEVGGYPSLAVNIRGAGFDTDGDGIPDSWEAAHGLNPNDTSDGAIILGSGYTNLENYLNELAGDTVFTVVLNPPINIVTTQ